MSITHLLNLHIDTSNTLLKALYEQADTYKELWLFATTDLQLSLYMEEVKTFVKSLKDPNSVKINAHLDMLALHLDFEEFGTYNLDLYPGCHEFWTECRSSIDFDQESYCKKIMSTCRARDIRIGKPTDNLSEIAEALVFRAIYTFKIVDMKVAQELFGFTLKPVVKPLVLESIQKSSRSFVRCQIAELVQSKNQQEFEKMLNHLDSSLETGKYPLSYGKGKVSDLLVEVEGKVTTVRQMDPKDAAWVISKILPVTAMTNFLKTYGPKTKQE